MATRKEVIARNKQAKLEASEKAARRRLELNKIRKALGVPDKVKVSIGNEHNNEWVVEGGEKE